MKRGSLAIAAALLVPLFAGCGATKPMATVNYVDIPRFMGDWYVIANIPTPIEQGAHNAVEHYALNDDGTIATTFTFRKDGFDGTEKRFTPTGFIRDTETNARWGMQFIWPVKADYRIVYLDEEYQVTIIGRSARDFVWAMARSPELPQPEYQALEEFIAGLGYDVTKLQRVPQSWPKLTERAS